MASFWGELRRRNVVRVGVTYVIVAWLLIEIATTVFPALQLPDWAATLVTVLSIMGLPLALIFAWAYELTPEGLKRTEEVPPEHSVTWQTGRKLDFTVIGLLVVALGVSIFLNLRGDGGASVDRGLASNRQSIAVLPFTSRSTDPGNALFAAGIHDELLTTLAKIGSLKVISRTSMMEYRGTTKNLKQIGAELGVANLIEGTVQKYGSNIRINVQLIDAGTDEHLWAESYDREMTTKNLFRIQSEISQAVALALKAALTPAEKSRISAVPTDNLEAYNLYLAGRDYFAQRTLEDLKLARQQFEKAIEEDPGFADPYSGLADSIMLLWYNHGAVSWQEAKNLVAPLLDKALSLEQENANVYASLGLFKQNVWEHELLETAMLESEAALERAIELNPNHAEAYLWLSGGKSAQQLHEEAIVLCEKALELDPLSRIPMLNLAMHYAVLGRHQDAINQFLRAIDLHPDWPKLPVHLGFHLMTLGRFDEGLAWALEGIKLDPVMGDYFAATAYSRLGDMNNAKVVLNSLPTDHPWYFFWQATIARLNGDYEKTYALVQSNFQSVEQLPWFGWRGAVLCAIKLGDFQAAHDYSIALTPELADRSDPDLSQRVVIGVDLVALAYAAQRIGENGFADVLLSRLLATLKDRSRLGAFGYGIQDVELYAVSGERELALSKLREAVDAGWRGYWYINAWDLGDNPLLEPLWDEPEFKAIVSEINADLARMRARADEAAATGDWQSLLARASQVSVTTTRE